MMPHLSAPDEDRRELFIVNVRNWPEVLYFESVHSDLAS